MRLFILSIFFVAASLSSLFAQTLSRDSFAQKALGEIQQRWPQVVARLDADFSISIESSEGVELRWILDNAYLEHSNLEVSFDELVERHLSTIGESLRDEVEWSEARIVASVKHRSWLNSLPPDLTSDVDRKEQVAFDRLNDDLIVVYAIDSVHSISPMTEESLREMGLRRSDLREIALANMLRLLPPARIEDYKSHSMLIVDGNYESSFILFDDIWKEEKLGGEGDLFVAVPARDVLIFKVVQDLKELNLLEEVARDIYLEAPYAISDGVYIYRDGAFEPYEP